MSEETFGSNGENYFTALHRNIDIADKDEEGCVIIRRDSKYFALIMTSLRQKRPTILCVKDSKVRDDIQHEMRYYALWCKYNDHWVCIALFMNSICHMFMFCRLGNVQPTNASSSGTL